MKTKLISILTCLIVTSCHSTHEAVSRKQMKEAYVYSFKMTFYKRVLLYGFNQSQEIKTVISKDRSGYGEPILLPSDILLIDSLSIVANQQMTQDSTKSIGKIAEGAQGKRVFDYVLTAYHSKWLDSIAKSRYKFFEEIQ
jgi:hypothetical protein